MYVYVSVYTRVYAYTCMCVYMYTHTYILIYSHTWRSSINDGIISNMLINVQYISAVFSFHTDVQIILSYYIYSNVLEKFNRFEQFSLSDLRQNYLINMCGKSNRGMFSKENC